MSHHGHSHGPARPAPNPSAGPIATPPDQKEVLRLCNKLMGDKKFRQVEGLLGDRRVQTFRGKMLLDVLREKGVSVGSLKADSERGAADLAAYLLSYAAVGKGPKGSSFTHRLFAQCEDVKVPAAEAAAPESEKASPASGTDGAKPAAAAPAKAKSLKKGGMYVFRPVEERTWRESGARIFEPEARYYWVYGGDQSWARIRLAIVVLLVLALCMFQLWPTSVRVGVWYLAVTVLLALVGVTLLQLTVFAVVWVFGWDLWLLPNLWADEPVWEIFSPVVTFKRSGDSRPYLRLGLVGLLAALAYFVYTAPASELNEFMDQQAKIVSDLYAGTLLGDGSSAAASAKGGSARGKDRYASMGYGKRKGGFDIPDIQEFEKMWAAEEGADGGEGKEGAAGAGAGTGGEGAAAAGAAGGEAGADGGAAGAGPDMDALLESHEEGQDEDEGEAEVRAEAQAAAHGR